MDSRLVQRFDDDYIFIDNSDDIFSTLNTVGVTDEIINKESFCNAITDVGSIFVKQGDGEIYEVWVHIQSIPCLHFRYDRVF